MRKSNGLRKRDARGGAGSGGATGGIWWLGHPMAPPDTCHQPADRRAAQM